MRWAALLLLAAAGCRDPDVVGLRLLYSPGLTPEDAFTKLSIVVEDAGDGRTVLETEAAPSDIGSGADVIDLGQLEVDTSYVVSLVAEAPSACRNGRAVGRSLPFVHQEGGYQLDVRVGCADEISASWEPLPEARLGARVAALPDGDAIIVGGTGTLDAMDESYTVVSAVDPVAPIVRYGSRTGGFSAVGALLEPRAFPTVVTTPEGVAVLGGLLAGPNVCAPAVEVVREAAVLVGDPLADARCFAGGAELGGGAGLLIAGGALDPDADAELYAPSSLEHRVARISSEATWYEATAVPLSEPGAAMVIGGVDPALPDPVAAIFRADCGGAPCFEALPADGPPGGTTYAASAYVPCESGGGAVYVTGGLPGAGPSTAALDGVYCYRDGGGDGRLVSAGKLPAPRWAHTAVAVRGERWRLLLVGGSPAFGQAPYANGLLLTVDACTCGAPETIEEIPTPPGAYLVFHAMDRLADGTVLIAGGVEEEGLETLNIPGAPYTALFVPDLAR